jgi:arylformamidase
MPGAATWRKDLIDLSRPLTEATVFALLGDSVAGPAWDEYRAIAVGRQQDLRNANSAICRFSLCDHIGTHVDAPSHVLADGPSVERLELKRLIGDAVVLDLRAHAEDYGYVRADFETAEPKVKRGDIVLIYSGYLDCGPTDRIHQTYLTPDAAQWLIERQISAIGCEPGGLEHCWDGLYVHRWDELGATDPWPVHRLLLSRDIYIIEGLTNLDKIAGKRVHFAALPLPLPGLTGSPVRAVAWSDEISHAGGAKYV